MLLQLGWMLRFYGLALRTRCHAIRAHLPLVRVLYRVAESLSIPKGSLSEGFYVSFKLSDIAASVSMYSSSYVPRSIT
jgi:hypothetical protein